VKAASEGHGTRSKWSPPVWAVPVLSSMRCQGIARRVAIIGFGGSGNRPGQCQDPWKYLVLAPPIENSSKSLRPESH
jgi:hypothetical protein